MQNTYFGKYRATVADVNDPEKRGRVRVYCPKVLGESMSSWCEPCIPFAYENGGDFYVPKLNDFVWIEFEEGNQNKPIVVGGLHTIENTSLNGAYTIAKRVFEFDGARVEMTSSNILIQIGSSHITLNSNGSIDIIGSSTITINGSTLNLN